VLTTVVETIVKLLRGNSAVMDQEQRTRNLIRQSTVGIAQCDLAGRFVQVNERFCQMLGYSFLDLRNKTFLELTHPEDREASRQLFEQMARHGLTSYRVEKRYVHENGAVMHADNFTSLINTVDGQRLGAIHVILDITDRKVPRSTTRH
jgi:PAS domain S-box-containing protein